MSEAPDDRSPDTEPLPPPGHAFRGDPLLGGWLRRAIPTARLPEVAGQLDELGGLASGELYALQRADRDNEPVLRRRDGGDSDLWEVAEAPLWREAERIAARFGLVATAYEGEPHRHARLEQFAKVYLFHPSSDVYTCPLAMTDGAARALLDSGQKILIERVLPHLTSRDPGQFWTCGQWMAEATSARPTRAVFEGGRWRLHGRKCYASAVSSQVALVLAHPVGAAGPSPALYYLALRDAEGRPNGVRVDRLMDNLGTRKVPTAQLTLDGAVAELVCEPAGAHATVDSMHAIMRTWGSVCAVASMRRGLALARSYAAGRQVLGQSLSSLPLHRDTLAGLEAETWGAFLMAFQLVELTGCGERGEFDAEQRALLRLLAPLTKLVTGRQAVVTVTEILECFGGAGYAEDTGLPALLRDTHVLPIWGGTTNVLALEALQSRDLPLALAALMGRASACVRGVSEPRLAGAARQAVGAIERAALWLESGQDPLLAQAGARRLALTLARALQLALLCEHAQWLLDHARDARGLAAALRYARAPVDLMHDFDPALERELLGD